MRWLQTLASLLGALMLIQVACSPASTSRAPAATSQPSTAAAPVEIRLGHGYATEEQLWLMLAKPDITPNQGQAYVLQPTAFRGNADRLAAYEAGQIDAGTIAPATALFAAEQGLPLKLVASIAREGMNPQYFNATYLAVADSGIASVRDLKGKTIGIVDFKSATDLWPRVALEAVGLDPERDVNFVVVPFPAMSEALRSHKIDAGIFPQPFYQIEKNKGGVVDVFTSKTAAPFDEDLLTLFFRPDFIRNHHAAVTGFLADFVAATRWYLANTREARQLLLDRKFVQAPADVYLDMKDWYRDPSGRVTLDGLSKLQDLQLKLGWQSRKINVDELADLSLLPAQ